MSRQCRTGLSIFILVIAGNLYGQAPGLPLVAPPASGGAHFFLEGDVLWATSKLNGNVEPQQYDKSFVPSLTVGMNMSADNSMILGYRWLNTQTSEIFNAGVPDLESTVSRRLTFQNVDLIYREKLGGEGAAFGMDVDMGFRLAWAKFRDETNAQTIAGPVSSEQQLSFFTGGTRIGVRPYFTFDQSAWRMTVYAQGNIAYLWGSFKAQSWVDQAQVQYDKDNSTLWNWDAEAGFSMFLPGMENTLQMTVGYRYETWNGERLGFITASDKGSLVNYGPFVRLQLSF